MTRDEIIRKALVDKMGPFGGIELFTSDDILIVAEIPEAEIEKVHKELQERIQQLTEGGQP